MPLVASRWMPKGYTRKNCRECDRDVEECGALSSRGLCQECAHTRIRENIIHLSTHDGWYFEHWRRRHAAAVGGILVDDLIERSA